MFRTRFKKDIIAEFLPPVRKQKKQRLVMVYDGMPSVPKKKGLCEFLSRQGFWVIYPRYRGAWESGGQFLAKSPEQDLKDVLDELPQGLTELAFGKHFRLAPDEVFVIGGSFGGAQAILAGLDHRISKTVAVCPAVDWNILPSEQKKETSNPSYPAYIRAAFGSGYRLTEKNWNKLHSGIFYNPAHRIKDLDPSKTIIFHAKDDPFVPWKGVDSLAKKSGIKLYTQTRGGHISTEQTVQKRWPVISKFFRS
jgi:pimeloyl-ACP methyl ester carboxylesterase